MQLKNWNYIKILLAVQATGSLRRAGRILGFDATTVSRRLKALQTAAGRQLYRRRPDGTLALTETGLEIAKHAEHMQTHANGIEQVLSGRDNAVSGLVRVTSVPMLANRLLSPGIAGLVQAHPHLDIELIPNSRDFSLTRREADIAVRLARPHQGGRAVLARRLADLEYAVYAARKTAPRKRSNLGWIGYEDAMAHLPQARWIAQMASGPGEHLCGLKVHDAETALEAVAAGIGKTALPRLIADADPRLSMIDKSGDGRRLSREVWLLLHRDLKETSRVQAVVAWIEDLLTRPAR